MHNKITCAPSENSAQHVYLPSLIRILSLRKLLSIGQLLSVQLINPCPAEPIYISCLENTVDPDQLASNEAMTTPQPLILSTVPRSDLEKIILNNDRSRPDVVDKPLTTQWSRVRSPAPPVRWMRGLEL